MDKTVITEAERKVLEMSVEAAMKQLGEINAYVSKIRGIEDLAADGQINLAQVSAMVSPEMKKSLLLGAASQLPHLIYLRNHEDEITDMKAQTQESREKIRAYISECRASIHEKQQARAEKVKEYKKTVEEKAAALPDDLPEMLDDLLNADVNKRIRQYSEICLKLYRKQQQIEQKITALEKVNAELISLYEQSDCDILGLQQKMDHLVELLAALDPPESILDSCVIVDREDGAEGESTGEAPAPAGEADDAEKAGGDAE